MLNKKNLLKFFLYFFLFLASISLVFLYKYSEIKNTLQILKNQDKNKLNYRQFLLVDKNNSIPYIQEFINTLHNIQFNNQKRFKIVSNQEHIENNSDILETTPTYIIKQVNKKETQNLSLVIKKLTYVPVGHFYWVKDNVTSNTKTFYCLKKECGPLKNAYNNYIFKSVESSPVLLNKLKQSETTPGLILSNSLSVQFKLLTKNKHYFLDDFTDNSSYPVYIVIIPINEPAKYYFPVLKNIVQKNPKIIASLNNNKEELSHKTVATLIQTGVTAISRALAMKIEATHDMAYPAQNIANFLKSADLTHTSNEVSFVPGCKPTASMRFCSNPKYFETLNAIGLDIVELTGNHNNDYGSQWNTWTIQNYYKKYNIDYFGGGLNSKDASKILYKTIKNTTIAFLGYNYYDTIYNHTNALATEKHAGANSFSFTKLKQDIQEARKKADIIIVDFQFQECYCYPNGDVIYPICYKPLTTPDQKKVFRTAIDYGADIVIGTQAHQPQTYELYKNKPIFYGLGNLFFDQIYWIGTRQGLILKHYFYNGKLIQTRIITTLQSKDLKQNIVWDNNRVLLLKLLQRARESM